MTSKRGIVTLAGGSRYFINAYAAVMMLRKLGCTLPVEWFYLGDEMKPEWLAIVSAIPGVTCVDLGTLHADNAKAKGGWQNKIVAIDESSFDEVLFLDADNFVWRDPEYLFDCPEYKEHGAMLWRDGYDWELHRIPGLTRFFGIPPAHVAQTESGQVLINKPRCKAAIARIREYNENSAETYRMVYGDKDTFYFGFLTTATPFHFVEHRPKGGCGCLLQHDPTGSILFTHLTGGKWSLNGRPFTNKASYPHVDECSAVIKELQRQLTPT